MGSRAHVKDAGATELNPAHGAVDGLVALNETTALALSLEGKHDDDRLGRRELEELLRAGDVLPGPGEGAVAAVAGRCEHGQIGMVRCELGEEEGARPARAEHEEVHVIGRGRHEALHERTDELLLNLAMAGGKGLLQSITRIFFKGKDGHGGATAASDDASTKSLASTQQARADEDASIRAVAPISRCHSEESLTSRANLDNFDNYATPPSQSTPTMLRASTPTAVVAVPDDAPPPDETPTLGSSSVLAVAPI